MALYINSAKCIMFAYLLMFVNSSSDKPHECEGVTTIKLHCEGRNITSFADITYSRFLIALHLQNNLIRVVEQFPALTFLQHLNLSRNVISDVSWKSLANVPNLLELDLSFNRITYVDVSLHRGKLILFSVSHNKLEKFSAGNIGILPNDLEFYRSFVEGNPLRCDCRMAWLQELALARKKCLIYSSNSRDFSCKQYRKHSLYLSLSQGDQNSTGFVCNSPENVRGRPIVKIASLATCEEQHVNTTTTATVSIHGSTLWVSETSIAVMATTHTTDTPSLVSNKTVSNVRDDEHESNTLGHDSSSSSTLLKVMCTVVSAVVAFLLANVAWTRKCRVEGDSLPPPPVNIPLQHPQNRLPRGRDSNQDIHHVYENDNDISSQDVHVYENDNEISNQHIHDYENDNEISGQDVHVYENDNEISTQDIHVYENDDEISSHDTHVYENDTDIDKTFTTTKKPVTT